MEKPVITECVVFFINCTHSSNSSIYTLMGAVYKKNDTFVVTGILIRQIFKQFYKNTKVQPICMKYLPTDVLPSR